MVQELAFAFGNARAYLDEALSRGMDVDDFAPRIAFNFSVFNNVLEEVAKFRAARRMWARIMKDRFGAKDPRSMMLRFHTQTAGVSLTAQQPDNNVIRVTLQSTSAAFGGCHSLHTTPKAEAWALPSAVAALQSLRTHQIRAP